MKKNSILNNTRQVLQLEGEAIKNLAAILDEEVVKVVKAIFTCQGKLVFTGIGKAGLIAQKVASTLSSLGRPSFFMHAAEASHGDLGMLNKKDLVFLFSNSGNTHEIISILPFILEIGCKTVAITGNQKSFLYKNVLFPLWIGNVEEACGWGLAPTTSTTLMLALGDAIAVAVLKEDKSFDERKFAFSHPGGSLGKKLLQANKVMRKAGEIVVVLPHTTVKDVLLKMTHARIGSAMIVDKTKRVVGIFSDGDLRRSLEEVKDLTHQKISEVMNKKPQTISSSDYVFDVIEVMGAKKIGEMPVIDKQKKLIGVICLKDIV